ncbi:DNA polymerase III subunit gamma and tau, partial [Streptomyces sp. NPDC049099]
GGWPTAAAPAGGQQGGQQGRPAPGRAPAAPQHQAGGAAQTAPAAPAAPAPAPAAAPAAGGLDPRVLWPNILEAVKNRRRFTWILLSQNAQVTGFDGTTLQLGFVNAGARDNFAGSGSEDVLRAALAEQFHVQWKIEAVVDPSGGGSAPQSAGGLGGGGGYGGASAGSGGYGAPASARPAPQPAPQPSAPARSGPAAVPAAPAPRPTAAPEPPPVSLEDDIPEDDDPDLDESALSGHELIVKELGATVVEEFSNE